MLNKIFQSQIWANLLPWASQSHAVLHNLVIAGTCTEVKSNNVKSLNEINLTMILSEREANCENQTQAILNQIFAMVVIFALNFKF